MHNVWPYVIGAYAVTGVGVLVLVIATIANLQRWARRAREEEAR